MSAHGEPAPTAPHADHPSAADHDGEPSDELEPGEPQTPMWLPLLGGALLLLVILAFVATRPLGKTTSELSGQAAASAQVADDAGQAAPNPTAPHPAPTPQAPPAARPAFR